MKKIKSDTLITVGFSIIILMFVFMSIFGAFISYRTSKIFENIYENTLSQLSETQKAYTNLIAVHRGMKDVILSKDLEQLENSTRNVEKYNKEIKKNFEIMKENDPSNGVVDEIITEYENWDIIRNGVFKLVKEGKTEEANIISRTEAANQVDLISSKIEKLIDIENKETSNAYDEFKDLINTSLFSVC